MPNVCKVGSSDSSTPCNGSHKPRKVTFEHPNSPKVLRIKENAINKLMNKAQRCYKSGKCREPLSVTAISIGGCDLCEQHIPEVDSLLERVAKTDIGDIVPVQFTELSYFKGGKELFDQFKCEGTPCFILNGREKMYEGTRGPVGVLASLFRVKNPLYK